MFRGASCFPLALFLLFVPHELTQAGPPTDTYSSKIPAFCVVRDGTGRDIPTIVSTLHGRPRGWR